MKRELVWSPTFEAILRARLSTVDWTGNLDPDLDLQAAGIGSLETITLMVELEDTFGITIPDYLLTSETFSSPRLLWHAIEQCLTPTRGVLDGPGTVGPSL